MLELINGDKVIGFEYFPNNFAFKTLLGICTLKNVPPIGAGEEFVSTAEAGLPSATKVSEIRAKAEKLLDLRAMEVIVI